MMSKECLICGNRTQFFVWGSSGAISDKSKSNIFNKIGRDIDSFDVICYDCCKKHEVLKERPPLNINKPRRHVTWNEMHDKSR